MHIKKIEASLGARVFSRDSRSLRLTSIGQELLRYANTILRVHSQAIHALTGPVQSGKVSLGIPDDYASSYLPLILRAFTQKYPAVEITIYCEPSSLLIPKIESGFLDVAIITQDNSQRGVKLTSEPLVWTGLITEDLSFDEPLCVAMYEFGSEARRKILAALDTLPCGYRIIYNSPYVTGQIAAAKSGIAVAVLTKCSVPDELNILHYSYLPDLPSLDVSVIWSKHCTESLNTGLLVDEIIELFH
jgi:DNA-binding transcriptional LysR family regulator